MATEQKKQDESKKVPQKERERVIPVKPKEIDYGSDHSKKADTEYAGPRKTRKTKK